MRGRTVTRNLNPATDVHHLWLHSVSDVLCIWYHCSSDPTDSNDQHSATKNDQFTISLGLFAICFFAHIAALGRVIDSIEKYLYFHAAMTLIALLSALVPFLYISYLIGSWLISKITFHVPCV